jgi:hypothetical protein
MRNRKSTDYSAWTQRGQGPNIGAASRAPTRRPDAGPAVTGPGVLVAVLSLSRELGTIHNARGTYARCIMQPRWGTQAVEAPGYRGLHTLPSKTQNSSLTRIRTPYA